uniref:DNA polymerase kappa n=1 Tax=Xenopus tropicalis TaxID=8364 RepID=A0A6I8SDH9_XENTR
MDNKQEAALAPSKEAFQFRMGLNDNKAGMEGLDKEKINKIIMDATKGSRFYDNELKKDQQVNQRIEKLMQQKSQLTDQQIKKAQIQVDRLALELERNRDLSRIIVHVDMDAFYAAVEMRDSPELKDKPMAVGSNSMLSTSNYLARRFGVRAAMPGFIAKKLCPTLKIVPPNFDKYRAVSSEGRRTLWSFQESSLRQLLWQGYDKDRMIKAISESEGFVIKYKVREILAQYDPNFLPMSLDEAYLDITDHLSERLAWPEDKRTFMIRTNNSGGNKPLPGKQEQVECTSPVLFEDSPSFVADQNFSQPGLGTTEENRKPSLENVVVFGTSVEEAVKEMRFRIEQKTTLTASAGIAPNMMLAKVCSDKNKPNGQYRIFNDKQAIKDFIKDLPIRKVPGIGKVTEKMLKALGIITCTDLYQQRALLSLLFSETSWQNFVHISLGLGSTHVERDGERKSMSTERTFSEISSSEEQYGLCQELCRDLAQDLQKEGLKGKTVTIKLKNVKFEVRTRALTVGSTVSTEEEIFAVAKEILKAEIDLASPEPLRLRLMGVRVSGFLTEEEKKHHQKSITGFLHVSKPGSSSSLGQSDKANPSALATGPQRQSFFNQKRAAREHMVQEKHAVCSGFVKSEDATISDSEGKTETLDLENVSQKPEFTCPICFLKESDWDLASFNKHIDKCLSRSPISSELESPYKEGAVMMRNEVGDMEIQCEGIHNADVCAKKQIGHTRPLDAFDDSGINNTETTTVEDVEMNVNMDQSHHSIIATSIKNEYKMASEPIYAENLIECKVNLSDTEVAHPSSAAPCEEQSFICPVCNIRQDTADLAAFNRHVDVCLNKGIIEKLTEETVIIKHPTPSSQHTGSAGRGRSGTNTNTKLRTKRPAATNQNPVSKKSKPNPSKNTIDRFFK